MDKKVIAVILVILVIVSAGTLVVLSGWLEDNSRAGTWAALSAVKDDNVYIFTGQADCVFTRPGPRLVDGVELMAKILYPDSFNTTIPYVLADDYVNWITTNVGMNYTSWDEESVDAPVTLVDAEGRNVTTSTPPQRIVSCAPSLTEIVYALGLGDRLVAVTDYCNWPMEVTERMANGSLVSVGGYYSPSPENVGEADGDIILLDQQVPAQLEMLSQLEGMGMNAIVVHTSSDFNDVYANIQMVGDICWESDRAAGLIASMQDRLETIQGTIGEVEEPPTMAFAVWLDPIYLSGNGTFANEMMSMVMGDNVYGDLTGWPEVGLESLLEKDPDFLLVSMMSLPTPGEEILQGLKDGKLPTATGCMTGTLSVFDCETLSLSTVEGEISGPIQDVNLLIILPYSDRVGTQLRS